MIDNWNLRTGAGRRVASTLIALLASLAAGQALAEERTHHLQGLFCNSEQQIDDTLIQMRRGLAPRAAVALTNADAVVCTFVDLLHYVVERPVVIKEIPGTVPFFKYEGTLVAVVVGSATRPVTPPVRIFFAIPERLADAPLEGGA